MLSNNEIQAMITAIGTGSATSSTSQKLRYHRVIVMTDADVDGSHIRTLILTFLYRQMPELIERGHVYIAVPPLYKVKLGNQEFYFEKDAQLEDLLARERIPQVERHRPRRQRGEADRGEVGAASAKELAQYEGYSARLRADFGIPAAELMIQHRLVEHEIEEPADVARRDRRDRAERLRARARSSTTRTASGSSSSRRRRARPATSPCRVELLASPIYAHAAQGVRQARRARSALPPFTVTRRQGGRGGRDVRRLRARVLDAAKQGIQLSRFKGLGEMNPEQLWETTMDPAKRLLIRVDVEDAHGADRVFSMLMGDQVEPRREFIEQNAKDVKFLDV